MMNIALFIIVAMKCVSSSEIRCRTEEKWRLDFDREGWVHCGIADYVKGFFRNTSANKEHHNSFLEYARCCKAPTPNENRKQGCKISNWTTVLAR